MTPYRVPGGVKVVDWVVTVVKAVKVSRGVLFGEFDGQPQGPRGLGSAGFARESGLLM